MKRLANSVRVAHGRIGTLPRPARRTRRPDRPPTQDSSRRIVKRPCAANHLTAAPTRPHRLARWRARTPARPPRRTRRPNRTPMRLQARSVVVTDIQSHSRVKRPCAANHLTTAPTRAHRSARWRAGTLPRPPRRTRRPNRTPPRLQARGVVVTHIQWHGVVNRSYAANHLTAPRIATVHVIILLAAVIRCPGLRGCPARTCRRPGPKAWSSDCSRVGASDGRRAGPPPSWQPD